MANYYASPPKLVAMFVSADPTIGQNQDLIDIMEARGLLNYAVLMGHSRAKTEATILDPLPGGAANAQVRQRIRNAWPALLTWIKHFDSSPAKFLHILAGVPKLFCPKSSAIEAVGDAIEGVNMEALTYSKFHPENWKKEGVTDDKCTKIYWYCFLNSLRCAGLITEANITQIINVIEAEATAASANELGSRLFDRFCSRSRSNIGFAANTNAYRAQMLVFAGQFAANASDHAERVLSDLQSDKALQQASMALARAPKDDGGRNKRTDRSRAPPKKRGGDSTKRGHCAHHILGLCKRGKNSRFNHVGAVSDVPGRDRKFVQSLVNRLRASTGKGGGRGAKKGAADKDDDGDTKDDDGKKKKKGKKGRSASNSSSSSSN